jgi:hypothetical protein
MSSIFLRKQILADVERYSRMAEMYKSGEFKTHEADQSGNELDTTDNTVRCIENIIREMRELLKGSEC